MSNGTPSKWSLMQVVGAVVGLPLAGCVCQPVDHTGADAPHDRWAQIVRSPVVSNKEITTLDDRVLSAADEKSSFLVMFGPNQKGQLARGVPQNHAVVWNPISGVSYLVGKHPQAVKPPVRIITRGTAIAIQLLPDTPSAGLETRRFFLLNPITTPEICQRAYVSVDGDPTKQAVLRDVESYVEVVVDAGGAVTSFGAPTPVPASGPVKDFVTQLKKRASDAGLPANSINPEACPPDEVFPVVDQ